MGKILILGGSGMLGATLVRWFASQPKHVVSATTRTGQAPERLHAIGGMSWLQLDVDLTSVRDLVSLCKGYDLVINAIGRIKQRIRDQSLEDRAATLRANALFAITLAQAAELIGCKVIQIATDCAFSGMRGKYAETDRHDADDLYGLSKSLGEVRSDNVFNLRCSIVGLELSSAYSLLNWFLSQPKGARICGYTNHVWNGIAALHFAKVCHGLLEVTSPSTFDTHLIPSDSVTKYELLMIFAEAFNRNDLEIIPTEAPQKIDRTLTTNNPTLNSELWKNAGYPCPPTIRAMVMEMASYAACWK